MAVQPSRRGRGFHKRRLRPNVARDELAEAAKTVVTDSVEPPLVRRQGKGKEGGGKGDGKGKGNEGTGKGKAAEPSAPPAPAPAAPSAAPSAPPLAAEPLPSTTAPSNSIVLNPAIPAQETVVPPLNPPSTVAPPAPPPPPAPPGQQSSSSVTTTSTAVTSVQTTQTSVQTSVQTQTTVVTTAQTSTQVSTQVTTIVSTQIDTSTSSVGSPQLTLTSSMIASPLPTLQTSLSTAVSSTSTPFVASTPYQAAPSSTTTSPAASRAPAIAPGTIAGIVVGILSFFFIILGAVCLCSRRTRRRLLTPVTRRFTNNTSLNDSRGVYSTGRRSTRGGDMHKSLMSEAESMAYTTMSPRDVKPPPMAMVEPSHGLSQNPVFMAPYNNSSRPNSWRTWRPSATFAQGLDPLPDNMQLPPPPPHALTANYSGFPRGSGVSTGEDSSMPEYGAWPPTASNADLTALTPGPGQLQQQQQQQQNADFAPGYVVAAGPDRVQSRDYFRQQQVEDGLGSYVAYSETPLATPRTPIVVEGEQLAPLATSQEASPVDNCDYDSGNGRDAGTRARSDDIRASEQRVSSTSNDNGRVFDDRGTFDRGRGVDAHAKPEGGIQEAQLGREAGAGGGHGGGPQGLEEEPPRQQGEPAEQDQQDEQDQRQGERGEQVFEKVAAVQGQPGLMRRTNPNTTSQWSESSDFLAPPPSLGGGGGEVSRSSSSSAGFSWSEAASEPYTAAVPRDGFGLSIIGSRHGSSRRSRAPEAGDP